MRVRPPRGIQAEVFNIDGVDLAYVGTELAGVYRGAPGAIEESCVDYDPRVRRVTRRLRACAHVQ